MMIMVPQCKLYLSKGTPYQHQAIHDVNTEFKQGNITPSLDKPVVVNQR